MKVVVAMDSLKGSLSSIEAGMAARDGILAARPDADVTVMPLADGGEGTADALIEGMGGERIRITVTGPMGRQVQCYYGWLPETSTAVMEISQASGITLVSEGEKDPMAATSYGAGEMIAAALDRGARELIIGIGGSAVNDGGTGMLQALGYEFLDEQGNSVGLGGQALARISSVVTDNARHLPEDIHICVACDVTNPLCGPDGATYVYGPQKGVTEEMKPILDAGMRNYAAVSASVLGADHSSDPGSGAAGGIGYALLSYLGAELIPGAQLIMEVTGLEKRMPADIVVTGEGCLDGQTLMGKAPIRVARMAKKYGAKVIALAGSVTPEASACNDAGIDAFFPVVRGITSLEEALNPETARRNITACAEQVFRLL